MATKNIKTPVKKVKLEEKKPVTKVTKKTVPASKKVATTQAKPKSTKIEEKSVPKKTQPMKKEIKEPLMKKDSNKEIVKEPVSTEVGNNSVIENPIILVDDLEEDVLDNTEVYDEGDIASALERGYITQALQRHKEKLAPETHPDFDGESCIDCGNEIPEVRLKMGKIRCVPCQEKRERNSRLYAR